MSTDQKKPSTIEEYYQMLKESVKEIKADDELTDYEIELILKGCKIRKGIKPQLPPGYEIVNGKYESLIKNTATNEIVGPVVEHDNIVSMGEFGMEFAFIVEPEEKHQWTQALKPIKTFSIDQMDSLKEALKNGTGQLTREELVKSIEKVIDLHSNKDTFAIPSHALMFTLLAMFSGKPKLIPKKLLEKPHSERSPAESAEADRYLASVLEKEKALDYSDGTEKVRWFPLSRPKTKKVKLIASRLLLSGRYCS